MYTIGDCSSSAISSSAVVRGWRSVELARHVEDLPGQRLLLNSSWLANSTRWRTSLRSLFQSSSAVAGPWASLLISTGVRPLDRNSRAKLVRDDGPVVRRAPGPLHEPSSLLLARRGSSQPSRYQSWLAEEALAGQPAGPLDAVEVVERVLVAVAKRDRRRRSRRPSQLRALAIGSFSW